MLTWLKKLLGIAPASEPLVLTDPVKVEQVKVEVPKKATTQKTNKGTASKPKKATKKTAPKVETVDLSAMKKPELLEHAKKVGAKANASMKKDAIIAAIKDAA